MRLWRAFRDFIKSLFRDKSQRPTPVIEPVKPDNITGVRERLWDAALDLKDKVYEIKGDNHNPEIVEMIRVVTGMDMSDETPWCAAAVGYLLDSVGLPHTNSLVARSYLNYGLSLNLEGAQKGDIVVFKRGNSEWQGHVGFYVSHDATEIMVLGGNQSDGFNIRPYLVKDLLGVQRIVENVSRQHYVKNHFETSNLSKNWLDYLETQVARLVELEPRDVANYYPGYRDADRLERVEFWKFFLSCMAVKESGVNTNIEYKESFRDRNGRRIISRGLFQLSIESSWGYVSHGGVRVNDAQELHDPKINLQIAVTILRRWIKTDGVISSYNPFKGGARYWSVLRDNPRHRWIISQCLDKFSN